MSKTEPGTKAAIATAAYQPILCMEHCPNHQIFGFHIPSSCTNCGTDLNLPDCEFHIPPFRIPNPFFNAIECPCSIVLRPTIGTFLRDYKPGDNLHIGITSSLGVVYEYNHDGFRNDKNSEWTNCIAIRHIFSRAHKSVAVVENGNESLVGNHWDHILFQIASSSASTNEWSKDSYNEWTHNCYTFVLQFLQTLYHRLRSLSLSLLMNLDFDCISTRDRFCEEFILKKTKKAGKYVALYRQLEGQQLQQQ